MTRMMTVAALALVLGCGSRSQVGPDAPTARRPPPVWTADGRVLGVERSVPDAPATYASIAVEPEGDEPVRVQPAPGWSFEETSNDARQYPSTTVAAGARPVTLAADEKQACVSFSAEARFRNLAHDHVVRLLSRCRTPVRCAVSTDVNPTAVEVDVRPSEHVEVLTYRGSPAREFEARVECAWRKPAPN